jgi:hypothetical protein
LRKLQRVLSHANNSTAQEFSMMDQAYIPLGRIISRSLLLGLLGLNLSGCVVVPEPRDGYYDHNHHRWYHEHHWHECGEHDWGYHCYR